MSPASQDLSVVGVECLELLDATTREDFSRRPGQQTQYALQELLSRYRSWGGNIGAFQPYTIRTSLSYRLREAPALHAKFLEHLGDLQEDVSDLLIILTATTKNDGGSKPRPSEQLAATLAKDYRLGSDDVQELLQAISEDIVALFRLSVLARKSSLRDRYAMALARTEPPSPAEEVAEMDAIVEQQPWLKQPALLWLRQRLALANNSRRRFMSYCTQHQAHLRGNALPSSPFGYQPLVGAISMEVLDASEDASTGFAETSASTTNDVLFQRLASTDADIDDRASEVSYVSYTNESTTLSSHLDVPSFYDVKGEQPVFTCPICRSDVDCATSRSWRRHVFSDLRAYVCTFKDCRLRIFSDSETWMQHETTEHYTFWACPYCANKEPFHSKTDLSAHVLQAHGSSADLSSIEQLVQAGRYCSDTIAASACQFCNWPAKIRDIDRSAPRDGEILVPLARYRRHVRVHLEQVALLVTDKQLKDANEVESPTSSECDPDEIFIAVIGETGVGKSSFISLLTNDDEVTIGHSLTSQTASISVHLCAYDHGPKVYLIDTPGFNDTTRTDTGVLLELAAWLASTYQIDMKLSGIFYLHPISSPRFTGSSLRQMKLFRALCGLEAESHVALVTTKWDLVDHQQGELREHELVTKPYFWGDMFAQGSRIARHDNTRASASRILAATVAQTKTTLKLQRELVDEQMLLRDTEAGQVMAEDLSRLQNGYDSELAEIQHDLAVAREVHDQSTRDTEHEDLLLHALSRTSLDLNRRRKEVSTEMRRLHVTKDELLDQYRTRIAQLEDEKANMSKENAELRVRLAAASVNL
ncbi:hypothetical protein LTR78_001210 [Recurvomyces mirabilis]|uniref:C2H2-type domain-containing protein n=1 Tax=Recurvomyces mirabilis TaxID=574656 RepID=A0AAE0WV01_9PEZI|nr:hypothetical protein LTR78_001210 [Recurvomyces mirabilis]KAK5161186.1 hypothetical protein LTS14_000982 [Recurvomyces mirabilis]